MKNQGMYLRHPKVRGAWAEMCFMTRATELGFLVTKPWRDAPYDLLTDHRGNYSRVQVKSTICVRDNSRKPGTCSSASGQIHLDKTHVGTAALGCPSSKARPALDKRERARWKSTVEERRFSATSTIKEGNRGSREAAQECSPRRKPWVLSRRFGKPRRGERKKLIPYVSLIVGHVVLLQERNEFVLERMLLMMLFLFRDIFCDGCDVGFAHAEDTVSGLPRKFWIPFLVHPAR